MRVKGQAIKNISSYIIEKFGIDRWHTLLHRIPEKMKEELDYGQIYSSRWYPFELYIKILDLTEEMFGTGDKALIFENARAGAVENMSSVFKVFIKSKDPHNLIKKVPLFFAHFFDFSTMMVEIDEEGHFRAVILNINFYPIFFVRLSGYLKGMLDALEIEFSNVSYNYDPFEKKVTFDITYQPARN